jgi:hypothetical protein
MLAKDGVLVGNPPESSISLALNTGNSLDGVEEVVSLNWVLDVGVDKEGVGFRVDWMFSIMIWKL